MSSPDVVRSTAVARREVRNSLDRLGYHLTRGSRGRLGVDREVAFLDALARQLVRVNGSALGVAYAGGGSFGQKALQSMMTGNSATIGRLKSSLLADFSANGLQPIRDQATRMPGGWYWVANASACPSCLSFHGSTYPSGEPFNYLHPSCLCIPMTIDTPGIRGLTDEELLGTWRQYGDPRYSRAMSRFEAGELPRSSLGRIEGVNLTPRGAQAVVQHLVKGEARQVALGASTAPTPTAAPRTRAPRAPRTPQPTATTERRLRVDEAIKQDGVTTEGTAKSYKTIDQAAEVIEDVIRKAGLTDEEVEALLRVYGDAIKSVKSWRTTVASSENYEKNGYWWKAGQERISQPRANALIKAGRDTEVRAGYRRYYRTVERELHLEVRRRNDQILLDWQKRREAVVPEDYTVEGLKRRLEWERANPRPLKLLYDATPEEIAQTFFHELTHTIDVDDILGKLASFVDTDGIVTKVKSIYNGGRGDPSFWYAASPGKPRETVAELARMFFFGDRKGPSVASTNPLGRSAAEWRAQYPALAAWVYKNIVQAAVTLVV